MGTETRVEGEAVQEYRPGTRAKRLNVTPEFILRMVTSGHVVIDQEGAIIRAVEYALPEDARCHYTFWNELCSCISMVVESSEYPEVPRGEVIPQMETPTIYRALAPGARSPVELLRAAVVGQSLTEWEHLRDEMRAWLKDYDSMGRSSRRKPNPDGGSRGSGPEGNDPEASAAGAAED